jgi:hypothetical protein
MMHTFADENGHRALKFGDEGLELTVLPDKGADVYRLVYRPLDLDLLWKNPVGLAPPDAPPQAGSGDDPFMWNYAGTWQELFPNCGDKTEVDGVGVPFHGEVAVLPWDFEALEGQNGYRFRVQTRTLPFALERRLILPPRPHPEAPYRLWVDESLTNLSLDPAPFVWGHHPVLGAPFLEAGCWFDCGARRIHTPAQVYEETARFAPAQTSPYPYAVLRGGGQADIRHIPGPDQHSHDDLYLDGLSAGWLALHNPRLELTFSLHWDATLFRTIVLWQVFGGAEALPFHPSSYALGLEPWVSRFPLGKAIEAGEAHFLAGGETRHTRLEARLTVGAWEKVKQEVSHA